MRNRASLRKDFKPKWSFTQSVQWWFEELKSREEDDYLIITSDHDKPLQFFKKGQNLANVTGEMAHVVFIMDLRRNFTEAWPFGSQTFENQIELAEHLDQIHSENVIPLQNYRDTKYAAGVYGQPARLL